MQVKQLCSYSLLFYSNACMLKKKIRKKNAATIFLHAEKTPERGYYLTSNACMLKEKKKRKEKRKQNFFLSSSHPSLTCRLVTRVQALAISPGKPAGLTVCAQLWPSTDATQWVAGQACPCQCGGRQPLVGCIQTTCTWRDSSRHCSDPHTCPAWEKKRPCHELDMHGIWDDLAMHLKTCTATAKCDVHHYKQKQTNLR